MLQVDFDEHGPLVDGNVLQPEQFGQKLLVGDGTYIQIQSLHSNGEGYPYLVQHRRSKRNVIGTSKILAAGRRLEWGAEQPADPLGDLVRKHLEHVPEGRIEYHTAGWAWTAPGIDKPHLYHDGTYAVTPKSRDDEYWHGGTDTYTVTNATYIIDLVGDPGDYRLRKLHIGPGAERRIGDILTRLAELKVA